jgi:hypothetical protein
MKRLLLGPALALPLILGLCHLRTTPEIPQLPKVPEVIREIPLDDFKAFPPITTLPTPVPHKAPAVKHRPNPVKTHARHVPKPTDRPVPPGSPVGPVEELPPQQGPICIFPFSMIPNCTPQVAGQ